MAEEPQPPTVHEGADDPPAPVPASAEDRKAAAALSSLDARDDDDDGAARGKEVDSEALGKAMQSLDAKQSGKREEEAPAKKVKIEAADVALVVEQLELSKGKATELLKRHDGDVGKAMTAFVTASA